MPATALVALLASPAPAGAQSTDTVHWAYASFLGTGLYRLDGDRDVYVLRVPPGWRYREASTEVGGLGGLGIQFQFPLTFGVHRLDGFDDILDLDNFSTVSFNPGVEFEYLASERWAWRAYGHLGWGTDTDGGESAWIWDAGLKTRYAMGAGIREWGLMGELFTAGFRPEEGGSKGIWGWMAGADFSHPIGLRSGSGAALDLGWDVSYRWLSDQLSFQQFGIPRAGFDDEWQVGMAFARRDGAMKFGRFRVEHFGLAYRFSSNGEYRAVTLNLTSPFNR